jgi:hypothetical protein
MSARDFCRNANGHRPSVSNCHRFHRNIANSEAAPVGVVTDSERRSASGPSRRSLRCTPMTAIEGEPDFNKASRSGTHQQIVIYLRSFNERLAKKRSY